MVLIAALLFSRGCGSKGRDVSQDEAVALARKEVSFDPDRYQIRFLQRGVPPHPYWGVSFYDVGPSGAPTKVELYLVDATTGEVTRAG
jgi:hypothetical protein